MASPDPSYEENMYKIDVESGAEMARLIDQDQAMTEGMGGLFPELSDTSNIFDVLDVGCGPGGWILEVARAYPEIEVTGVDISNSMTEYAATYAQVQGLTNAHFRVANALGPLDFPDASFDLVNMRLAIGFVPPPLWPQVLSEFRRVLRPGGIVRWTEGEWGLTNKPAVDALGSLLTNLARINQMGFSPSGRNLGINAVQKMLVRNAGFQQVQARPHAIDYSYGERGHAPLCQDYKLLFPLVLPLFLMHHMVTQEEFDRLYEKMQEEMQEEDFCALCHVLTVWGYKPS